MFHIVLVHPEIAPNTGNVIRLSANTGCTLHLVAPLGFALDDARLRRAGLDYHEYADLRVHEGWQAFRDRHPAMRLHGFSRHAQRGPAGTAFEAGDALVFGSESAGLPQHVLDAIGPDRLLRLPMRPGSRSLNLSNAVAVAVYEAWRQQGFDGAV